MCLLRPESIKHDNVVLFFSDRATYKVKARKSINAFYLKIVLAYCVYGIARQVYVKVFTKQTL